MHPRLRLMLSLLVQYVSQLLQWIRFTWQSFWEFFGGPILTLDSGRQVRVGRKIAEGGFSYVFRATDIHTQTILALKRIPCDDPQALRTCQHEASVHHAVHHNKHTLQLLGMAYQDHVCYMLFPYMPHSLRSEVNQRIFQNKNDHNLPPWNTMVALPLFRGICEGVQALHRANFSHRDVKLENVLFASSNHLVPVLMDFGSVGPLTQKLSTRQEAINVAETASSHTTISYRPPELFSGEVRVGDPDLDYTKVDVWSLGCTLFAMLYGASPFESEFHRRTGKIQVVECTQLRVLGKVPFPAETTPPAEWYTNSVLDLILWMLTKDRQQRPTLSQVMDRVDAIVEGDGEPMNEMI